MVARCARRFLGGFVVAPFLCPPLLRAEVLLMAIQRLTGAPRFGMRHPRLLLGVAGPTQRPCLELGARSLRAVALIAQTREVALAIGRLARGRAGGRGSARDLEGSARNVPRLTPPRRPLFRRGPGATCLLQLRQRRLFLALPQLPRQL